MNRSMPPTELFLDDLEDLLLIEFLWQALDSCQSLTTIALWWIDRVSRRISMMASWSG